MDTRMKFLEHELAEQEREMNIKHEAGAEAAASPAKSENTDVLERKVRELEAMVKGLTEELPPIGYRVYSKPDPSIPYLSVYSS